MSSLNLWFQVYLERSQAQIVVLILRRGPILNGEIPLLGHLPKPH